MDHKPPSRLTVLRVSWPFMAVMLLMLAIASLSVVTLSAMRAYVAGLAAWSGAERDTVMDLSAYIHTGSPAWLKATQTAMAVWDGDRTARLELLKPHPDYHVVRQGLLAGMNHRSELPGMIGLFRAATLLHEGREPMSAWAQADAKFATFPDLARRVAAARAIGTPDDAQITQWFIELWGAQKSIVGTVRSFARSIDASARVLTWLLLGFLALSTAILLGVGYAMSRRVLNRADALAKALQETQRQAHAEQERADVLLRSIGDAVIATDRHGTIEFLNAAAERLTGWSVAEARGQPIEDVFRLAPTADTGTLPIRHKIEAVLSAGEAKRLTAHGAELVRRDGSTAPIGERATPLKNQNGEIIGMALVMRDVTPERHLADQLRHQANHDALTGMPNRMYFERRMAATLQPATQGQSRRFTAMFLDLDRFKIVNDSCGHHAGDELIRRVATCIREQLRDCDLLARLGGDEFGLLLHDVTPDEALQLAERVRLAVAALQFTWKDQTFSVHASIGVVHDDPARELVTDVLRAADLACYVAKHAGRNCVHVYDVKDGDLDTRREAIQWTARLNHALEHNGFVLQVQEIRSMGPTQAPGRPCFEVLLRLHDEPDCLIASTVFAAAAERFGLMPQIDRWVIAQVFAAQARAHRLGRPLPLHLINLSGAALDDAQLPEFIAAQQRQYHLPHGTVGFELAEAVVITRPTTAITTIEQLKTLGCPIALDDFGIRAPSCTQLRELPVDYLKIDAGFVRGMTRDPIALTLVEAMHKMAQAIGIRTVATGADDEATLSALCLMKIDLAQGTAIGAELYLDQALAGVAMDDQRHRISTNDPDGMRADVA